MSIRVTHVRKPSGRNLNPHEAIESVKWTNEGTGKSGVISRLALYDWIKDKGGKAYVKDSSRNVAFVGTRVNANGTKFLQTYADGVWKDNLLSLPSF